MGWGCGEFIFGEDGFDVFIEAERGFRVGDVLDVFGFFCAKGPGDRAVGSAVKPLDALHGFPDAFEA
jgi:hypothetical protein